jgi:2-haloacid dehalogenase
VKSAGLEGVFAHVMSVDEVKIYKPNPRVYRLAPHKLKVARTAIGFVSSNFWDVAGAKAFGFWTCWVNRSGTPPDELGLSPDATVKTLTDLADLIKA